MPKSTKIMMIILVVFTIGGIILATINSQDLLSQTIPKPQEPNDPELNTKIYEKKPQSVWKDGVVDSGATLSLECKTQDEIKNIPVSNNKYTLKIRWKIAFDEADQESIKEAYIEWQIPPLPTPPEKSPRTNILDQIYYSRTGVSGSGTVSHTFEADKQYFSYQIILQIEKMKSISSYKYEGYLDSNVCGIRKTDNPDEASGGEIGTGSGGNVGGGSAIQDCKDQCADAQGCGHVVDPICNGFCSFNCYILQMMADLFNWSFGFLTNAVGLS
jgi:hypothetical protein